MDSWQSKLPELLAGAAEKRTLVVIVDGLDQLKEYGTQSVEWLPQELPVNVKLIVTLWDGSPLLAAVQGKLSPDQIISVRAEAELASVLYPRPHSMCFYKFRK